MKRLPKSQRKVKAEELAEQINIIADRYPKTGLNMVKYIVCDQPRLPIAIRYLQIALMCLFVLLTLDSIPGLNQQTPRTTYWIIFWSIYCLDIVVGITSIIGCIIYVSSWTKWVDATDMTYVTVLETGYSRRDINRLKKELAKQKQREEDYLQRQHTDNQ